MRNNLVKLYLLFTLIALPLSSLSATTATSLLSVQATIVSGSKPAVINETVDINDLLANLALLKLSGPGIPSNQIHFVNGKLATTFDTRESIPITFTVEGGVLTAFGYLPISNSENTNRVKIGIDSKISLSNGSETTWMKVSLLDQEIYERCVKTGEEDCVMLLKEEIMTNLDKLEGSYSGNLPLQMIWN
ncbi:hypothetical protein N8865_02390 [Francisellaceae bacterium]|nr:hypothetical protein [Francisellaceae bacterium]